MAPYPTCRHPPSGRSWWPLYSRISAQTRRAHCTTHTGSPTTQQVAVLTAGGIDGHSLLRPGNDRLPGRLSRLRPLPSRPPSLLSGPLPSLLQEETCKLTELGPPGEGLAFPSGKVVAPTQQESLILHNIHDSPPIGSRPLKALLSPLILAVT